MKKLLHWFNGIKLRYKLAIFYSLFCFLPVMLLFWLSFLQMRSIIDDKGKMNLQSYLQQSVSSMDRTLDGYNSLSDYIAFDRTLAEVFSMEYGTPYEQYEQLTQKVDPILRTASYFHGGMQQITIYTDNGMVKHDTTVAPVSEIGIRRHWSTRVLTGLQIIRKRHCFPPGSLPFPVPERA